MNLSKRFENLRRRRVDPLLASVKLDEAIEKTAKQGVLPYILSAMQPIDLRSTNKLFEQADRVFNQLEKNLPEYGHYIDKNYQGSATNDTHIRYYSDIDLLTPTKEFEYVKAPLKPSNPWKGDDIKELKKTRFASEIILEEKFPKADLDTEGSKAIKISGGSLSSPVDIVTCAWLNTFDWKQSGNIVDRGIRVLDKDNNTTIKNFPFMHNALILNKRDITQGNSSKLIRFLKTLIADIKDEGGDIEVSSYDVCALVYNMNSDKLFCAQGGELLLLSNFIEFVNYLDINRAVASDLEVPNRTRKIFSNDGLSFSELFKLKSAVQSVYDEATFGSHIINASLNDQIAKQYYQIING